MKTSFLSEEDIHAIINSWNPGWIVIGGVIDTKKRQITLVYGDLAVITVPFSEFPPSGTARPNFRDFEIIDSGMTIRLGTYEAGVDSFYGTR